MEEYFGFCASKIKSSELEGELVEMTPREFIQKTMPGAEFLEIESSIDKSKAQKYLQKMKQGEKFPIPYLINYANCAAHEGKHRAYAAMMLGVQKIPVQVIDKKDTSFYLWE
jgi:hypothetical protein